MKRAREREVEHVARAVDDAAEDVAAEDVGAEEMRPARALERRSPYPLDTELYGAHRWPGERDQQVREQDQSRDPARSSGSGGETAEDACARTATGSSAVRDAHHGVLRRGFSSIASTSASEVGEDVDGRGKQRDRLDDRHVANGDRVDEQLAESGVGEDRLHDHDAADQIREVERGDVQRRAEWRSAARGAPRHASAGRP